MRPRSIDRISTRFPLALAVATLAWCGILGGATARADDTQPAATPAAGADGSGGNTAGHGRRGRHKNTTETTTTTSKTPAIAPVQQWKTLSTSGELIDRVVAVVNDGVVMQSQLDEQERAVTARLRGQNVALPPADVLRQQILERLVLDEIQAQHAERAGIKVGDDQLNAALEDIAKREHLTLAQLPEHMAADGVDYAQYRAELRREIARQILRQRDVVQRIVITPRELDQYLDHEQKSVAVNGEFNVSHILIAMPQDSSPAARTAAANRAAEVVRRARAGEDFSKLAVTYSQAETALEGGSLGWRKGTELPTFLSDVVTHMKSGEVSDAIQTPTGYHIVRLNDSRESVQKTIVKQVHLRHILLKPTEIEDDATIQQKLVRMREQVLAGKEDFAVLARTKSQDPGSAVNGGDLGWAEPNTYVPAFAATANALKDQEISEPFKSEFGWHVVQMLGRRDFDATRDNARERAFQALRDSRVEEATELWLRQIRDESYVDMRPIS